MPSGSKADTDELIGRAKGGDFQARQQLLVRLQKTRKWGRRHPAVIWSGVFALLIAFVASALSLLIVDQKRREAAFALAAEAKARLAEQQARVQAMATLRSMTDELVENQLARATLTDENKEFLRKIIEHYEGLAAVTGDDATSRAIRAEGCYRVGHMRYRLGEFEEAATAFADALAIQNQLVAEFHNQPDFRHDLANSHHNLGNLLRDTGKLQEAPKANADALALQKQLAAEFPSRPEFLQALASSHNELGLLLADAGKIQEAATAFEDALVIQKQMAVDFPNRPKFRQDLAGSHFNLANLVKNTGKLQEAATAYANALAIQKQLAAEFPTRPDFRRDLAGSYNSLGNLLKDRDKPQEAVLAYADAVAINKQLAAEFPNRPEFRQSGDTGSVMYAYLAPGQTRRGVTTQDLSVLDTDAGRTPEPLTAAPWRDRQAIGSTQADTADLSPNNGTVLQSPGIAGDFSPILWDGFQIRPIDSILLDSQQHGNGRDAPLSAVLTDWRSTSDFAGFGAPLFENATLDGHLNHLGQLDSHALDEFWSVLSLDSLIYLPLAAKQ